MVTVNRLGVPGFVGIHLTLGCKLQVNQVKAYVLFDVREKAPSVLTLENNPEYEAVNNFFENKKANARNYLMTDKNLLLCGPCIVTGIIVYNK